MASQSKSRSQLKAHSRSNSKSKTKAGKNRNRPQPIRYAVVGLGYISQVAVLPAFKNARENSKLVALVSGDPIKLKKLGRQYGVKKLYSYAEYDTLLQSGEIDAVYIGLPNHLHHEYTMKTCAAGIHVLCEKPMAPSARECKEMIDAANSHGVQLMIAYRLHFEETHLQAIEILQKKKIGTPLLFNSVFSFVVNSENIRANSRQKGGGPLFDIGIYCLNAARYLFQSEPIEVSAISVDALDRSKPREETISVTLKFENGKIANFVCSFGTFSTSHLEIIGTQGSLTLENAYEYVGTKTLTLKTSKKTQISKFKSRDQFAPELIHFSECILKKQTPGPSGTEGLADITLIEAIFKSAELKRAVPVLPIQNQYSGPLFKTTRPRLDQEIHKPPVKKPKLIKVVQPSQEASR